VASEWLRITLIAGVPQSTLRYWCSSGRIKARKRPIAPNQNRKVWELYKPDLIAFSEEQRLKNQQVAPMADSIFIGACDF
jgi:hypothetical protein